MPELPEVETIRRVLAKRIIGKKIKNLELSSTKVVRTDHAVLEQALVGQRISRIDRIGKLLIFCIDGTDDTILIHLKMTGQLIYRDKGSIVAGGHSFRTQGLKDLPNIHTRATITFADHSRLFFNDMRLFAYLELVNAKKLKEIKPTYGIEPGTAAFVIDSFRTIFHNRKTTVKALLLDQSLVAGIGNIYADESCFLAGILPMRRAHTLIPSEIEKLYTAVDEVIALGIEKRGTTFSSFVDGVGKSGGFLPFLCVYNRTGKPCKVCGTAIKKTVCAGRGTHYCPTCQK